MSDRDISVNQRIKFLIEDYQKCSQKAFAEKTGISQSAISSLFSQRENRPGLEMLQKIAIAYPEISLDWLLIGRGLMLRGAIQQQDASSTQKLAQLTQQYILLTKQLEDKRAYYREVSSSVSLLKEAVAENKSLLKIQREAIPKMDIEGQRLMLSVLEQQKSSLADAQERYKAYLPLHARVEADLLRINNLQIETETQINDLLSADL